MTVQSAKLFAYSAFFHRLLGLWPKNDQPLGNYWQIKCRIVMAVVIGIPIFHFSALTKTLNKNEWPEFIVDALSSIVAISKVVPLIINRKNVLKIVDATLKIVAIEKESSKEKEIAHSWLKLQKRLSKFLIVSYVTTVLLYFGGSLFNGCIDFPLKGARPELLYIAPWFQIFYVLDVFIFIIRLVGVLSCDLYCVTFICQLCCELQIVQHLLTTIVKCNKKSLFRVIERHQIILIYGQMICENFTNIFLLQYILMSMIVCFAGIIALYTDNLAVCLKMSFFVILGLMELLFICLIGEKIKEESTKVARNSEDIYVQFLGNIPSIKLICFIIFRAMKPLQIRMGSSIIDLRFYAISIKRIYSFFTVFKTLVK